MFTRTTPAGPARRLRRDRRILAGATAVLAAATAVAAFSAAPVGAATDTAAPTLVNARRSPTTVDVTDTEQMVNVSLRVTDPSRVLAPRISYRSTVSASNTALVTTKLLSGTDTDGVWGAAVTIPARSVPGRWELSIHPMRDRAGNEGRFGPPQNVIADVTVLRASAPGRPTAVTATPGDRSATVRWTAPSSDGGATITSYRVETYRGDTALPAVVVAGTARTAIVRGLTNGVTYTVRVVAVNRVGPSTPSASRTVVPAPPT